MFQWFLVYSLYCVTITTIQFQNISITRKMKPIPMIMCTDFTQTFSSYLCCPWRYFKMASWGESVEYLYGKKTRKLHCPEGY